MFFVLCFEKFMGHPVWHFRRSSSTRHGLSGSFYSIFLRVSEPIEVAPRPPINHLYLSGLPASAAAASGGNIRRAGAEPLRRINTVRLKKNVV